MMWLVLLFVVVVAALTYRENWILRNDRSRLTMLDPFEIQQLEKHPETLRYLAHLNQQLGDGAAEYGHRHHYQKFYERSAFFAAEAERHTP